MLVLQIVEASEERVARIQELCGKTLVRSVYCAVDVALQFRRCCASSRVCSGYALLLRMTEEWKGWFVKLHRSARLHRKMVRGCYVVGDFVELIRSDQALTVVAMILTLAFLMGSMSLARADLYCVFDRWADAKMRWAVE
jgi:hypothetical protein